MDEYLRQNKIKAQNGGLTPEKARIISRLMGDGALYKHKHDYTIKYEVKDEESLQNFAKDLKKVYGLEMWRWWNKSGKTGKKIPFVRARSKLAYEDLLKYGSYSCRLWRVPKAIFNASKKIQAEFLKAFYDDEGSVVGHYIRLYSINRPGLLGMSRLLAGFGIDSYLQFGYGEKRNVYSLTISKRKNVILFTKKIGFCLKRKNIKLKNMFIRPAIACSAR